ncbi:hypothetical protein FTX61_18595 [Nitriliruptoraceae bacterium ZYF776]|nr:hypothetical protein [Profundirhabdus halotolerans]
MLLTGATLASLLVTVRTWSAFDRGTGPAHDEDAGARENDGGGAPTGSEAGRGRDELVGWGMVTTMLVLISTGLVVADFDIYSDTFLAFFVAAMLLSIGARLVLARVLRRSR